MSNMLGAVPLKALPSLRLKLGETIAAKFTFSSVIEVYVTKCVFTLFRLTASDLKSKVIVCALR